MTTASNLGFPRIGAARELKWALERYWAGTVPAAELTATAQELRRRHWLLQQAAGIDHIPSNDFALYDHVLDAALMVGCIPERFGWDGGPVDLDLAFAMARGREAGPDRPAASALEMTKWFDTNYHYLVPELAPDQTFQLASQTPILAFQEARAIGVRTRPVLLGPVSFLLLSKARRSGSASDPAAPAADARAARLAHLDGLLPVYAAVLRELAAAGADWVQLDEPCLVGDLPVAVLEAMERAYSELAAAAPGLRLLLATYFGALGPNLETVLELPIHGLHVDAVRGAGQLDRTLGALPDGMVLQVGVVDGRNVWRTDPDRALPLVRTAVARLGGDRVQVAPSCSLLHVPVSLEAERGLDPELRTWLAFATEKLAEVVSLARAADLAPAAEPTELAGARRIAAARRGSDRAHDSRVRARLADAPTLAAGRSAPRPERRRLQDEVLGLPLLPTTTIGSFPQTPELRAARAQLRAGALDPADYAAQLEAAIADAIRIQEQAGLDVLVHGEPERSDMVEYFAERLRGFALTRHGWVQSYGSRCVRPPLIYGDVSRPQPMTVRWATYAAARTTSLVKGMLTGPTTICQWSFVRDDEPAAQVAAQIALALRDEVCDLEAAGIRIIQVDEPALREGLPLRRADQAGYLQGAVDAFRIATGGAAPATQVHTHMCYAEFGEILQSIADLDADVISIEAARSQMELLGALARHGYPGQVGPGVWDIHSPLVPTEEEIVHRLERALAVLPATQLWVNPDCGLKTRRWAEVEPSLHHLVGAARRLRASRALPADLGSRDPVGSRPRSV